MNKFLLKGLIFFFICLGLSYVLDYMIQEGLKTSNYREITKWNEVTQGGINAEILIVGSSRALVHFDCEYIEKATGKSCYNLGFDGTTYPLQKLMLELYLSNNIKPKELIWSLDYHSFTSVPDYYGFEQLVPYRENSYVQKMLSMHETPNYQFQIPLFRYSYNPKMKVIGIYSYFGKYHREPILIYGYRKQNKKWDGNFDLFKKQNSKGHNVVFKEELFHDFTALNQQLLNQKISIEWVVAPYLEEYNKLLYNRSELLELLYDTAGQLKAPFYDYSSSEISHSRNNFYNATHLNQQGMDSWMGEFSENLITN
ncbi:hypothetical protein E4S40_00950 [Algoriphagus kandeliae]|uniref:DUF1574 domain-containing protein n=1 Tax=Algoriphagus kandeliae TaxID=2562278 RepID=A0A4Y9R238_9BACT|nr:hypothetical protein [Algoriphagus kandeliae]TFV97255.1 hypothetical protein E4S40_00950 [Algoriphagus kandeliae]